MSLTKQQIFDKVAVHLLTQGARSTADGDSTGSCLYRAPDGKKCALGCLISDRVYLPMMEGLNIDGIANYLPQYLLKHVQLLDSLQGVHDNESPSQWRTKLSGVAKDHNLNREALRRFRKRS